MSAGLADKTPGQQWHRVSHRVLQDSQHRSQEFPGGQLVKRLEHERGDETERSVNKVVPVRKGAVGQAPIYIENFEDIYGFRGDDPRVYYLNPWEFLMQWELEPLRPPSRRANAQPGAAELTKWKDA